MRILFSLLLLFTNMAVGAEASFVSRLSSAAIEQTRHVVIYNGAYRKIPYPMGDVPAHYGVCTDVVIRAYRQLNIDLQQKVHEDMQGSFKLYPKLWGLAKPDSNIDHRRVPNLQTFFTRHGQSLPLSTDVRDYQPGDLVTWLLPNNMTHIGIVVDRYAEDGHTPLIVHNIGAGPKLEDVLFAYQLTGHYRYQPDVDNHHARSNPR